jgi:hypothetical protein
MATNEATARIRENALRDLKDTGSHIAAQLDIEAPTFEFFRDKDYQQAQELAVLAAFNNRVLDALKAQSERGDDVELSIAETAKRRPDRASVSKRG